MAVTKPLDIPMPKISPNFTIEDIHKIREWNYERRKGMTPDEICEDTRRGAAELEDLLAQPIDPLIVAEVERRMEEVRVSRKTLASAEY